MSKTFVKPITCGRMGNFLFQAACAMAYAWRHGLEFTLPTTTNDPEWNPIYLQHLVKRQFSDTLPYTVIREEGRGFNYHELPFKEEWRHKNIFLKGYWQSEKYFEDYSDEIIRAFGYEWYSLRGIVSVHVRRGDYLTIKKGSKLKHPFVTKAWLERAMAKFDGFAFRFFSDDIEWCIETFSNRKDCIFSRGQDEERDLIDMSCCEHHICSASTFSWWGAWLNQNPAKIVIMPNHWLSPGWGGLDTSDVVPARWIKLP